MTPYVIAAAIVGLLLAGFVYVIGDVMTGGKAGPSYDGEQDQQMKKWLAREQRKAANYGKR